MRVGDEDRQLSAKELEYLILSKNKDKLRWDSDICKDAKLTDISSQKLKVFVAKLGLKFDSLENMLRKLGLLSGTKICNAAVILFAKKPEYFFPNAKLRCAVFGTSDTSITIDMHDYTGDLFQLIEEAEKYILDHINIGIKVEGLERKDLPEIDKEAIREALINAFCHRDYWSYDSVAIALFKDRMEIRNPGILSSGLTIEKIRSENISERRNELIAEMFHRVHFVEKWGRGISLILSKEPQTEFKEVGRKFVVVFQRKDQTQIPVRINGGVNGGVNFLYNYIKENPGSRVIHLKKNLNIPVRTIERLLKQLKDKNKIEFRGSPKTGGYWIK